MKRTLAVLGSAAAILVVLAAAAVWRVGGMSAGGWVFSQNEDGVQVYWTRDPSANRAPLFRAVCNEEDGVVWFNSRALVDDALERRAEQRRQLDLVLAGDDVRIALEGYVASAPEESTAAWEAVRNVDLARVLSAPDLVVSGPSFSLKGGGATALTDFVRACPPAAEVASDMFGWGTSTSLANGYVLDLPRRLFRIVRGDRFGRFYESEKGASLLVASSVNATQQTLQAAIRDGIAGAPELERETLRRLKPDSAVISGMAGGSIVYYKARATCGGANFAWFVLTYDPAERGVFDAVVTRMSRSFDRTTFPDGRPICP